MGDKNNSLNAPLQIYLFTVMFALVLLILRAEAQITTDVTDLNLGFTATYSPYYDEDSDPVITLYLSNITAPQGGTVKFSCSGRGSPKPIIQLTRRTSSVIPEIDNSVESVLGGSVLADLTLKKISLSEGGWYRCIVFNSAGYVYSDAFLTVRDICDDVMCPGATSCVPDYRALTTSCECVEKCEGVLNANPVCGSDCKIHYSPCHWNLAACQNSYPSEILSSGTFCPDTSPPVIQINSAPIEVFEGAVVVLEGVKVEGFPTPIISWYREGGEVLGEGTSVTILATTPAHSGKYYSKAVNCGNVTVISESVDVLVKVKQPPEGTKVCSVFGDPHVSTFDGLTYKVGGECYYVLAMECHVMDWIVYGYFTSCGVGSCLEAVSLFRGRESVILERGWVVRYRGERYSYNEGENFKIGSFDFNFDGMYLTVKCVDVGLTVVWDGFTGLQISLSGDEHKNTATCGICGNNDGVKDNELAQLRSIGKGDGSIKGFVHSWRVDRKNMCTATTAVAMSKLEPCGSSNFIKNEASKKACQALLDSSLLQSCWGDVSVKEYYRTCLVDTCSIDLLTEEYPVVCAVASAYIKTCELRKGVLFQGDWRAEIGCPGFTITQQAIMSFGVEG